MSKLFTAIALLGLIGLTGCIGSTTFSGGSLPGSIVTDINYPSALNPSTNHEIEIGRDDIEIIGAVSATAESFTIVGIIGQGDSGYGKLLEAARAKGADGIMNVTIDTQIQAYVFGAYNKVVTTLSGTAYKYK